MKQNLFIKYKGVNPENDSEINLASLGNSLVGFELVIKEIFKISKIKSDISISVGGVREGSQIFDIILSFGDQVSFDNMQDLLNFSKVASLEFYNKILRSISENHKNINDFAKDYPVDFDFIAGFIGYFIGTLLEKAKNHKKLMALSKNQWVNNIY